MSRGGVLSADSAQFRLRTEHPPPTAECFHCVGEFGLNGSDSVLCGQLVERRLNVGRYLDAAHSWW